MLNSLSANVKWYNRKAILYLISLMCVFTTNCTNTNNNRYIKENNEDSSTKLVFENIVSKIYSESIFENCFRKIKGITKGVCTLYLSSILFKGAEGRHFIETYGSDIGFSSATHAFETLNGEIITLGYTNEPSIGFFNGLTGLYDINNGNTSWMTSEGGKNNQYHKKAIEIEDGKFNFIGCTNSENLGNIDVTLGQIDNNGDINKIMLIGGQHIDTAEDIIFDGSDTITIGGYGNSNGAGSYDIVFTEHYSNSLKIKPKNSRVYGTSGIEKLYSMVYTKDGGIAFAGSIKDSQYTDILVCKENKSQILDWCTRIKGSGGNEEAFAIYELISEDIIFGGYTTSLGQNNNRIFVSKISKNGTLLDLKSIESNKDEVLYSLKANDLGEIFLGGYSKRNGNSDQKPFLYKIDNNLSFLWGEILYTSKQNSGILSIEFAKNNDLIVSGYTSQNVLSGFQKLLIGRIPSTEIWDNCTVESVNFNITNSLLEFEVSKLNLTKDPEPRIFTTETQSISAWFQPEYSVECWETNTPTISPSFDPTMEPSPPTINPTFDPTYFPSVDPTKEPTILPSYNPSFVLSDNPTSMSTSYSSNEPTIEPTYNLSFVFSDNPTSYPSNEPTIEPTYPTVSYTNLPTAFVINTNPPPTMVPTNFTNSSSQGFGSGHNITGSENTPLNLIIGGIIGFIISACCFCIGLYIYKKRRRINNNNINGIIDDHNDSHALMNNRDREIENLSYNQNPIKNNEHLNIINTSDQRQSLVVNIDNNDLEERNSEIVNEALDNNQLEIETSISLKNEGHLLVHNNKNLNDNGNNEEDDDDIVIQEIELTTSKPSVFSDINVTTNNDNIITSPAYSNDDNKLEDNLLDSK